MTIIFNNVTIGLNYKTFEFGRNNDNSTEVYLFGIANSKLIRYTFQIYSDQKVVNVTDVKETTVGLDGNMMKSVVSIGYYVISCADCATPGVYLYHHDLVFAEQFPMVTSPNSTINLAVYESSKYMMTLFVAGWKSIDLI